MERALIIFSTLLLLAASPVLRADGADSATDSQGNAVRGTSGSCVGSNTGKSASGCSAKSERITFRILQGMIPQPYATYTLPPPSVAPETVLIALAQPWETGSAMLSPTQREELYAVMTQLEAYRRIESFEVVTYPGASKSERQLAEKRAKSLSSFLASVGVPPGQIVTRIADPAANPRSELNVTVRGRR